MLWIDGGQGVSRSSLMCCHLTIATRCKPLTCCRRCWNSRSHEWCSSEACRRPSHHQSLLCDCHRSFGQVTFRLYPPAQKLHGTTPVSWSFLPSRRTCKREREGAKPPSLPTTSLRPRSALGCPNFSHHA